MASRTVTQTRVRAVRGVRSLKSLASDSPGPSVRASRAKHRYTGSIPAVPPADSRNPLRLQHFRSGPYPLPSAFSTLPPAFLLAHSPGVPTAMSRRGPGGPPVGVPCLSGNSLRLGHLHSAFCTPYSTCCFRRAFPLNQILLSGEPTRLVQAWTASQLRSRNNAGILLFLGQHVAVLLGGGAEPRPPVQLLGCPRIFGFGPAAPALFAASHIP